MSRSALASVASVQDFSAHHLRGRRIGNWAPVVPKRDRRCSGLLGELEPDAEQVRRGTV